MATYFNAVVFCKFNGLTINHESFWIRYAPESQKECKFYVVPFNRIIFKLFPPRSPLGNVWLYNDTECKGWWISPTTCTKYLAKSARYTVVLLILVSITFIAFLTKSTELNTVSVILIIGNTPS